MTLGCIDRTVVSKSQEGICFHFLFCLEYCVQFFTKKNVDKLEQVQLRVAKMVNCMENKSYEERLEE